MGTWEMMVHWDQGGKDSKGGNLSLDHKKLKILKTFSNTHTYMHACMDRHTDTEKDKARETETDTHRKTIFLFHCSG